MYAALITQCMTHVPPPSLAPYPSFLPLKSLCPSHPILAPCEVPLPFSPACPLASDAGASGGQGPWPLRLEAPPLLLLPPLRQRLQAAPRRAARGPLCRRRGREGQAGGRLPGGGQEKVGKRAGLTYIRVGLTSISIQDLITHGIQAEGARSTRLIDQDVLLVRKMTHQCM